VPDFAMAWLDCEFGGLNPRIHDITEIAVIVTDDRLVELDSKEWKIQARPDRISEEAAKISGYTEEAWVDALPIRQVLTEFADIMPRGKVVVPAGQNVRMDVQFIELGYEKCEIPYPFDYHVIDLATLFYSWSLVTGDGISALSLRQAAVTAGLIQGQVPHRAMADARLTLETFRHYVGQLAPRPPADTPPVNPIAHMEREPR
jgi:DNA polymerase III epsilon subunit-like protein